MRRVTTRSTKDGLCKTPATRGLEAARGAPGQRILVADLGPQATATTGLIWSARGGAARGNQRGGSARRAGCIRDGGERRCGVAGKRRARSGRAASDGRGRRRNPLPSRARDVARRRLGLSADQLLVPWAWRAPARLLLSRVGGPRARASFAGVSADAVMTPRTVAGLPPPTALIDRAGSHRPSSGARGLKHLVPEYRAGLSALPHNTLTAEAFRSLERPDALPYSSTPLLLYYPTPLLPYPSRELRLLLDRRIFFVAPRNCIPPKSCNCIAILFLLDRVSAA